MSRARPGLAALLIASVAVPAASHGTPQSSGWGPSRSARAERRHGTADDPHAAGAAPGEERSAARRAGAGSAAADGAVRFPGQVQADDRTRDGPLLSRGGSWTRLEGSLLVGSQLVNQDLGFARNIYQTVSAEADDVGFGEHAGARGAFFVTRHFGAEASYTRTSTAFEFSVTDQEAGTLLLEPLLQDSREISLALVAQAPFPTMIPYGVVGYGWRSSEVEGGERFRTGAAMFGLGVKVPFPRIPVALAFDYRRLAYPGGEGALHLPEGAVGAATVSVLTMGVTVRIGRLR